MTTIKSFTDISQSKVLAEMLPLESADMYFIGHQSIFDPEWEYEDTPEVRGKYIAFDDKRIFYPCWSLAALLGVLPEIQGGKPIIALDDNYITYPHMSDLHTKADSLVDACVAMILKLKENKLI